MDIKAINSIVNNTSAIVKKSQGNFIVLNRVSKDTFESSKVAKKGFDFKELSLKIDRTIENIKNACSRGKAYKNLKENPYINPVSKEIIKKENFKNLKFLVCHTPKEKEALRKAFIDNCFALDEFFATIHGTKPACYQGFTANSKSFSNALKKLSTFRLNGKDYNVISKNFCDSKAFFVLNKDEVCNVIDKNKDIFAHRLNIEKSASSESIYNLLTAVKSPLLNKADSGDSYNDLIGLIIGYPKKSSMVFQLEKFVQNKTGLDMVLERENLETYKQALLKAIDENGSPYKGMDSKFIEEMKDFISNITELKSFHMAPYSFLSFSTAGDKESAHISEIINKAQNYKNDFSIKELFL